MKERIVNTLKGAKEALMNRDPHTRAKECYDSGHVPCKCTLCDINALIFDLGMTELVEGSRAVKF